MSLLGVLILVAVFFAGLHLVQCRDGFSVLLGVIMVFYVSNIMFSAVFHCSIINAINSVL